MNNKSKKKNIFLVIIFSKNEMEQVCIGITNDHLACKTVRFMVQSLKTILSHQEPVLIIYVSY